MICEVVFCDECNPSALREKAAAVLFGYPFKSGVAGWRLIDGRHHCPKCVDRQERLRQIEEDPSVIASGATTSFGRTVVEAVEAAFEEEGYVNPREKEWTEDDEESFQSFKDASPASED